MSISLSNLPKTPGRRQVRVGRGIGSGHGKTSGRGMKGQRSRSGSKRGLKLMGLKQSILRLPKLRGFRSLKRPLAEITLSMLNNNFKDGETVTLGLLKKKSLAERNVLGAKVLSTGSLNKKLTIKLQAYSASAKKAIEGAGGKVIEAKIEEIKKGD